MIFVYVNTAFHTNNQHQHQQTPIIMNQQQLSVDIVNAAGIQDYSQTRQPQQGVPVRSYGAQAGYNTNLPKETVDDILSSFVKGIVASLPEHKFNQDKEFIRFDTELSNDDPNQTRLKVTCNIWEKEPVLAN